MPKSRVGNLASLAYPRLCIAYQSLFSVELVEVSLSLFCHTRGGCGKAIIGNKLTGGLINFATLQSQLHSPGGDTNKIDVNNTMLSIEHCVLFYNCVRV